MTICQIKMKNNKKAPVKLDRKDKRILKELFDDARKPVSEIARTVKLSKEVVNYRINRLHKSGFLVGFNTVIDVKKLGWMMFLVYVRLKNLNSDEENYILLALKGHKNIAWIIRCIGNHDIVLKIFAKDQNEVGTIMKSIEAECKIDEYQIDYLSEEHAVPFSFIYEADKETHVLKDEKETKIRLEEIDYEILAQLAKNARMPLSELVVKLKSTREIIRYHLKKLETSNVILKYRPDTLPALMGYNWYFLILKTGNLDKATDNKLKTYLLNCENATYFYKTVGSSDIQIELRVKTTEELSNIISEIRSILQSKLKRHEILLVMKEPKYTYFTECLVE